MISNCFIEALLHKIRHPKNVRVLRLSKKPGHKSHHYVWYDGGDRLYKHFTDNDSSKCFITPYLFTGEIKVLDDEVVWRDTGRVEVLNPLVKLNNRLSRWCDIHLGGIIHIGKRITVYGHNAMHWGVTIYTKKYGYICFRLPLPCYGRWHPLYLYFSPNATPWAATFMIGRKYSPENWVKARLRKYYLGHNFDCNNEVNYKRLVRINYL